MEGVRELPSRRPPAHMPASATMVLDALADHIDLVLDHWYDVGRRGQWSPQPGSFCLFEYEKLARKLGPAGPWDSSLGQLAVAFVQTVLAASAQHLEGIAALLRAQQVFFPLALPVRSILETAGYVSWLLDPRITARQRAARTVLAQLEDLKHARLAAKAFRDPSAGALAGEIKRIDRVKIPGLFYKSELADGKRPGERVVAGQHLPGLTEKLDFLVDVHQVQSWSARGMYAFLSNGTHPTPHHARSFMVETPTGAQFHMPDSTTPYRMVRAAIMSFIKGWTLQASYLGGDESLPGDLGEMIDDLPAP